MEKHCIILLNVQHYLLQESLVDIQQSIHLGVDHLIRLDQKGNQQSVYVGDADSLLHEKYEKLRDLQLNLNGHFMGFGFVVSRRDLSPKTCLFQLHDFLELYWSLGISIPN